MAKVLIYAMLEGFGGVEEYVLNLTRYGKNPKEKYGYVILGEKTIYEEVLKKAEVDYFFIPPKRKLCQNIREMKKLLKRLRGEYDTVYFNTSGLYYPVPYLLAIIYGYKIVLHSHSIEANSGKKWLHLFNRYWINQFVRNRLACSIPAAAWMFGKRAEDAVIIPNAVDLQRFQFNENTRMNIRNKLGLRDELLIGHIGRLTSVKNQKRLLDIFSCFIKNGNRGKLILVGDGEDRKKLYDRAIKLEIEKYVIFYGSTSQPEKLLCAIDCFVMPSLAEGFPITLVEAQACSVPCVVSKSITAEVNLTGQVSFVSLEDSDFIWVQEILKAGQRRREENISLLQEAGYDLYNLESHVSSYL